MEYLNVLLLCLQGAQIKVQKERHLRIKTEPKVFLTFVVLFFEGGSKKKVTNSIYKTTNCR